MSAPFNLPPGATMREIEGPQMPKCVRCKEEVNVVNDVGICEDCETEMETECKRCHNQYELRFGEEPTEFCDHCAHIVVAELRKAIEAHRAQKADDRCIEDDDRLYEALGDGWPSYAELERRVASLEAEQSPIAGAEVKP